MTWIVAAGMLLASAATPLDVILDTDLGDDIDDTWALYQLLGTPELNLKLVVTASQNTPLKTKLVAKMFASTRHAHIPIGTGKKVSDDTVNQIGWLGDFKQEDYTGVIHEDGVQAMIDLVMSAQNPIAICAIGPLTNLAEALRREPRIAEKTRLYLMAGSVHIGYGGKTTPEPEWNVHRDLPAFKAVLEAPWEITIAPLDICGTLKLQGDDYNHVAQSAAKPAKVVIENYDKWVHRGHYAADSSSVLFDTVAVYLVHDESWVEIETLPITLEDNGLMRVSEYRGRPIRCALRWKDEAAFKQHLIKTITGTTVEPAPPEGELSSPVDATP